MVTFLMVLVIMSLVFAGLGIRYLFLGKAMNAGCSKEPTYVNGEKIPCIGCTNEQQDLCEVEPEENPQS
jgi:hypothetical protein